MLNFTINHTLKNVKFFCYALKFVHNRKKLPRQKLKKVKIFNTVDMVKLWGFFNFGAAIAEKLFLGQSWTVSTGYKSQL